MADKLCNADLTSVKKALAELLANSPQKQLNILITGKTGVGKSRLLNALVWKNVAEEGRQRDSCTNTVSPYKVTIEGIEVRVWDSPGLQEGTPYEAESYITNLKSVNSEHGLDVVIYCLKMDDTKFYHEDKKAIRLLTQGFGKETWGKAVIALTFANRIEDPNEGDKKTYFVEEFTEWERQIHRLLTDLDIDSEVRKTLPIVPAGNYKNLQLPTCDNWLAELWMSCYFVMSDPAGLALYQISKHRLTFPGSDALAAPISSASATSQRSGPSDPGDIPREIPLNKAQEKKFWTKMLTAIGGVCAVAAMVVIGIIKNLK